MRYCSKVSDASCMTTTSRSDMDICVDKYTMQLRRTHMQQQHHQQQQRRRLLNSNVLLTRATQQGYSRVIGVLFCCRRRYSEILLPYLQRMLVTNGGVVDRFLVFEYGTDGDDPLYPQYVGGLPGFSLISQQHCRVTDSEGKFVCAYSTLSMIDPHALYLKLDDDLLYVAEDAVLSLLETKLSDPNVLFVHGNGFNHMHASYVRDRIVHSLSEHAHGDSGDTKHYYDRSWMSAQFANEDHALLTSVLLSGGEAAAEQFKYHGYFRLDECRCSHPQPGNGYCSRSGYYRTSINFILFALADIRDHMDLIAMNDEIAFSVLIHQRLSDAAAYHHEQLHRYSVIDGEALYAHGAFDPQRHSRSDVLHESRMLHNYCIISKERASQTSIAHHLPC